MPRRRPLVTLLTVLVLASAAQALHFYLDANEKRCFIEEIPTDTVVEGRFKYPVNGLVFISGSFAGHYRALEWSEARQEYVQEPELGILVEVEVTSLSCSELGLHRTELPNRK
jgi:p24 family protein alpha